MEELNKHTAADKLKFYRIARDLFNDGRSHPQVIEELTTSYCDEETATIIADKALPEKWDQLFDLAKKLFAGGKTYAEVITHLEAEEEHKDVVKLIVDTLYEVKTFEIESEVESPTNIAEGLQWVVISAIGIPIIFLLDLSIVAKIILIVVFVGALIQYLVGLRQRKWAKQARKFMKNEQD